MNDQTLIFWQPMVSPHVIPLLHELKKLGYKIVLVVERLEFEERRKQGWIFPDLEHLTCIDLSVLSWEDVLNQFNPKSSLHIFSGIRAYPTLSKVMNQCKQCNHPFAIYSEALHEEGLKGVLRKIVFSYDAIRLRKHVLFILAVGDLGVCSFKNAGFDQDKIFSYAYFPKGDSSISQNKGSRIRFLFVGRLIERKGLDWLIRSLRKLNDHTFEINFIGDGPLKKECQSKISSLKNCQSNFYGSISMDQVFRHYAEADYLILPSTRTDGWGAVISEASQSGTPCIVSSKCGASCLIQNEKLGYLVNPAQEDSLYEVMKKIIKENLKPADVDRQWIKSFAHRFSAQSGAQYLDQIIQYSSQKTSHRPVAPWDSQEKKDL